MPNKKPVIPESPPPDPILQRILEVVNNILMKADGLFSNVQKIIEVVNQILMKADGLLMAQAKVPASKAPPSDPNITKILAIVEKDLTIDEITGGNVHFLLQKVNNLEIRVSDLEQTANEILAILTQVFPPTSGSKLIQLTGDSMAGPYSIKAGESGTFLRSNLPPGSLGLFPGTVASYGVTDPAVQISSDPSDPTNPDKFQAAVAATDTAPSFDVTVAITPVNADGTQGTQIVNTFTVTIVQAPPPGQPTTASDLTQTS